KGAPVRREGRLTIQSASGESGDRMRSLASVRRAREREREKRKGAGPGDQGRIVREVVVPDAITVQELGQRMAVRGVDIIKMMMRQGAMLTINDVLDADTAELIASEFGHNVRRVSESDVEQGFIAAEDVEADTQPRPPVVAVMGHVDHGKTSLLDALRSTTVTKGEHGGITQHIGAYQVETPEAGKITFLDTPGHAAFSAMRARGANVGDIVILVVAADDGVMPQTVEAINHAKAAEAPIIVAVNKIDKPDADPTKVINELLQYEIIGEAVGGDTQIVQVSATQKMGLDDLLEAISLQAEVMDLRANPDRSAEGTIIEAKLDKGRGPVATVIVDRGTLKRGDIVVAGSAWGKVRALVNERNEQPKEAGPSTPVEILGLDQAPSPGDTFAVVEDEARARELTEYRERQRREKRVTPVGGGASLADMMAKLQDKKVSELPLIVKADVQGSAEAIVTALENLGNDEVRARIILSGAGGITESDVQLAKGAGCPILGFNVRASAQARALAEREGVEIRYYAIIYDLLDDMKGVLSGLLSPIQRETWLGNATLLQVFDITKVGKIAGCRVTDGVVRRGARTRIIRNDVVIMEQGVLQTLKRFKDDVAEVISGMECGLGFQNFQDLKEGDQIECFTLEEVARSL
ncbi:MAG: translation initiation factor IF-2, partial [Caulobacteraceae bacterium]|nr:translation initiation factor IF-2 [Caulobacter sp.]